MTRRLLNALALLSLLLCVAALGVALRGSFSGGSTFGPQTGGFSLRFTWRDGHVYTYWCPGAPPQFWLYGPSRHVAGVRWSHGASSNRLPVVAATLPQAHVWAVAMLAATLPALNVRRRRRGRRPPPGVCTACGYDLRATPDRCPECGAVP